MFRKAVVIGGILIGVYLAVHYASGASKDETAFANGGANLVRAFQGR